MNFTSYNKLHTFNLKGIIKLLKSNKIKNTDVKCKLSEIIYHYHMKTIRASTSYNLLDFVHDLYELCEYDLIDDIIQIDYNFCCRDNIYDSLLAFDLYKDETTDINTRRLKLLLTSKPKNYKWDIFYKEFLYNVTESGYEDYIPEIYLIVKESCIDVLIQHIKEYWDDNKYFLFEDNQSKIEYINNIII